MKTNYIAVFYFGKRRRMTLRSVSDPMFFLRCQVETLLRLDHSLDQITFVVNGNIPNEYLEIITPLEEKHVVKTLKRKNEGLSYGGWSHAVEKDLENFDYFIFNEDDWVFCRDGFDSILIDRFNSVDNCSMVCGLSSESREYRRNHRINHCVISIGLTSREKLRDICDKNKGILPYSFRKGFKNPYKAIKGDPQIYQTRKYFEVGEVVDITNSYRIRFLDKYSYDVYGKEHKEELIKQADFI